MSICSTFRKWQAEVRDEGAEFSFESADHDFTEQLGVSDLFAAEEALGVEHFEQRREAVGVAVVGGGGEEEAMFEKAGEIAHGAGEIGIDGVAR